MSFQKRSIRGLRSANAQLKAENEKLTKTIQISQENCNKEIACIKSYEKKMRDQQDVLAKMQVSPLHKSLEENTGAGLGLGFNLCV